MLDKDKLILLFNINVNDIDIADVSYFAEETAKQFERYFDDSVKCIFAITRNDDKPAVQAVTDFPTEGIEIIKSLAEALESGDEEVRDTQIKLLKGFIETHDGENK